MLAFALSDETSENDASILQESLMRHLHLTSKNIEENDDVDDTSLPVEEEKYVFEKFSSSPKKSRIFVFRALLLAHSRSKLLTHHQPTPDLQWSLKRNRSPSSYRLHHQRRRHRQRPDRKRSSRSRWRRLETIFIKTRRRCGRRRPRGSRMRDWVRRILMSPYGRTCGCEGLEYRGEASESFAH